VFHLLGVTLDAMSVSAAALMGVSSSRQTRDVRGASIHAPSNNVEQ
jgi:hypothetical protein